MVPPLRIADTGARTASNKCSLSLRMKVVVVFRHSSKGREAPPGSCCTVPENSLEKLVHLDRLSKRDNKTATVVTLHFFYEEFNSVIRFKQNLITTEILIEHDNLRTQTHENFVEYISRFCPKERPNALRLFFLHLYNYETSLDTSVQFKNIIQVYFMQNFFNTLFKY